MSHVLLDGEAERHFTTLLGGCCDGKSLPPCIAAMKTLNLTIQRSEEDTMMGIHSELKRVTNVIKQVAGSMSLNTVSLSAACEMYRRYVTRTSLEFIGDFSQCKIRLLERGQMMENLSLQCGNKIRNLSMNFIRDGMKILVHGCSPIVFDVLINASHARHFEVVVTENRPALQGPKIVSLLLKHNIPSSCILDSAVGFFMENVDIVITGAEAVVENGGIINSIGTYTVAAVAHTNGIPVFVLAEGYKFARLFPLSQHDVPGQNKPLQALIDNIPYSISHSDYTPPNFITLLITDVGILTPSAVSDELIKLYQ